MFSITNLQRKFDNLLFFYLFIWVGNFSQMKQVVILVGAGSIGLDKQSTGVRGLSALPSATATRSYTLSDQPTTWQSRGLYIKGRKKYINK